MRRRTQTVSGRRTPTPPTNPPEPTYTHSAHDIRPDGAVYDHDGPSVKQQERLDSPILNVVIEHNSCGRDGCEAAVKKNHIYTVDSMSDELEAAVRHAAVHSVDLCSSKNCAQYADTRVGDFTGHEQYDTEELMGEYVAQHVTIVDYDEVPVLTIEFDEHSFGYWYPETTEDRGNAGGECHGYVDEATRLGI